MSKPLIIVESPAKAKTVAGYVGADYTVLASLGHVRDLPKKGMSIDIDNNFAPLYEVSSEKKKVIAELKRAAKGASEVLLASDPDREGEAISWHLAHALGLDPKTTKRVVWREVTKQGVLEAIKNPRTIDQPLVDAQQARRVLDRLVGYELSPVLWKKVQPGLSAGRVQSVAVRLVVEREREIEGFEGASKFKIIGIFDVDGGSLKAELGTRFTSEADATAFMTEVAPAVFTVTDLSKKPGIRKPAAPFTTSTLQQEASRKLSMGPRQTMSVAQRLYESGLISYMRTDSVNLSETALTGAAAAITKNYGADYHQRRTYATKAKGAQEAHEAIRPTEFSRLSGGADSQQQRLYQLIWQRAIASQMAEAKLTKNTVIITPSTRKETFGASAESIDFDGFLKVYQEGTDEENEGDTNAAPILPPMTVGQELPNKELTGIQVFDRPKARYTEASLIKKLEEMQIGRPSTYAPTISTIQDRGYVEKGEAEGREREVINLALTAGAVTRHITTEKTGSDRGKLIPTPVGRLVTDFLVKFFPTIVDYQFTAKSEDDFDQIEAGKEQWQDTIKRFYTPFHKTVEEAAGISRQEASQAREVGADPKTGKPIIARLGRYGPMLQLGLAEDDEKPTFAPLPAGKSIETVTMEEALELFKLPRNIGKTADGEDMLANFGRFGPYVKYGSAYVSIKPDDPFTITAERALELIAEKKAADAQKNINQWGDIKVLNGRFGPYITDGTKNAKIPKGDDPAEITEDQAKELLAKAPTRTARGKKPVRKTATKKPAKRTKS